MNAKISYSLLMLLPLLCGGCSRAPDCHFSGDFDKEANAGCLVVHQQKALFVEGKNGKLSLPGGGLTNGEAPQCTAEREVWEETGIEVIAGDRLVTFENGFQLFECRMAGTQVIDGSERPWRFEINAIHWLASEDFDGKKWRFPDQIEKIKRYFSEIVVKENRQ